MRVIPWLVSDFVATLLSSIDDENAGQPQPDEYFDEEGKSRAPHPPHVYVPSVSWWRNFPLYGCSVPA